MVLDEAVRTAIRHTSKFYNSTAVVPRRKYFYSSFLEVSIDQIAQVIRVADRADFIMNIYY